jgi:peptide subunit release factor 1 (eRF1)
MRELIRRLAHLESDEALMLSIYLDVRPQKTDLTVRPGRLFLEERLRAIEKTFWPRGVAYDSVRADAARIAQYLDAEVPADAQGVALFTCAASDLFETAAVGVPFENQVVAASAPDLFQLARLLDDQETAVVAVVDTNTARLFVTRTGFLDEVGGPDDKNTKYYRKVSLGGLNEARYQRHADERRAEFARETAAEIERVVQEEGAARLILAGDDVALPLLRATLAPRVDALVQDVLRLDIRAPRDLVAAEIAPILAGVEAAEEQALADQLIGAIRASGLGVAGAEPTRRALEHGQVDVLLFDPTAGLDEATRGELVRLAVTTSATVEVVENYEPFRQLGGVGALLRYRHAAPEPAAP